MALGDAVHFRKKQIIFEMGTVPQCLYYLRSGVIRVLRLSANAEQLVLFSIKPGHFVCEVRCLAELPLTFQVESVTDTAMVAFSRPTVVALLESNAQFRRSLFSNIAMKMCDLGASLLGTAYEDNSARMMRLLHSSAVRKDGVMVVLLTQQDLGEYLGIHRVTVNRLLRRLEDEGSISVRRKHIVLLEGGE